MVLRGAHATDVWMDGQWCRTDAPVGAIAVTAASDVDALRWRSDVPIETVHLFIPADTIAIAASQLQAAGTRSHTTAPLVSFADSAVSSVLIGLLQAAQQGAPDLYASNTVHWLAMHLLLTQRLEQTGEPVRTPDPRIERAIACIHQRYVEPLSLAQLAAVACLSRFHFARLFRLETGMSPHAYLLAHRMQAAKDLLAATDVPIAQIARRTGFVRAAQFAVAFRSAAGLTATEFRQRSNADQAELRDRGVHSNAGKPPQR
ncbi:AraC family transcriptional regulator [Luteimonas terrae]|uniref:AraC family transcriptional regulator n=1 Tax=Luteimonas terrae TaxID=1530191 RepID=A0ABU1Y0U1_9GAMM|nr:AraC family transcriptional regulator [Luteimonas terrae]MDR7194643.1 AraC family transcriptional regulator [Luteimonas terrae]